MKKGFTLIELVVAVALLAMVISFASVIFRVSIEAYRTAGANTEIMQKLRAVTDQLNADFKGQIWNPPGRVLFNYDDNNKVRSDSIVFFANGDFQSTGQYDGKTVVGNVASIFYSLANVTTYSLVEKQDPKKKILVRRQTILTGDSSLTPNYDLENLREYCVQSLAELIADTSFDANSLMDKPDLDPNDVNDLVMYMVKGVDDFTIQYVGTQYDENGDYVDKDKEFNEWRPENYEVEGWPPGLYPLALKFTFTLYDSKGIIERGREFTHIVYLGD